MLPSYILVINPIIQFTIYENLKITFEGFFNFFIEFLVKMEILFKRLKISGFYPVY